MAPISDEHAQQLRQHAIEYHADLAERRQQHIQTANALTRRMAEIERVIQATEEGNGEHGSSD